MIKILNRQTTCILEERTTQGVGALSSEEMIEQLANSFCAQFQRDYRGSQRIVVFAGPNTNGAVALLSGSILNSMRKEVECVLLDPRGNLPEIVSVIKKRVDETGLAITVVRSDFRPPVLDEQTYVIDGICGLDAEAPFSGSLANVAAFINSRKCRVISLDLPSGMQPESNIGNDMGKVIRATHTYAFHGPKLAFFFEENQPHVGQWSVLNVGVDDGQPLKSIQHYLFTEADMEGALRPRRRFSNKYDYGRVLVVAGSKGMIGASILTGRAALTAGAGHVTLHVPMGNAGTIHAALPEVIVREDSSALCLTGAGDVRGYDAVAIGPGLGRSIETALALDEMLSLYDKPLIIDADAVALLGQNPELLHKLPKGSILTPHVGEFDRLFGDSPTSYDRVIKASTKAQEYGIHILLKGPYSATCTSFGHIIFNSSGNSGLATAGSGDVLTGILLALLGQRYSPMEACIVGSYMHGYAADLYQTEYAEESLIASDIIRYLPRVFKSFRSYSETALRYY